MIRRPPRSTRTDTLLSLHDALPICRHRLPGGFVTVSNCPAPLGFAVVGAGYWGPNLIRNILRGDDSELRWVCDLDIDRAARAVGRQSAVPVTDSLDTVLDDPTVQVVAVATPAHTHVRSDEPTSDLQ